MTPVETRELFHAIYATAGILLCVLMASTTAFIIALVYHIHRSGKSDSRASSGRMLAPEWDEEANRGDAVEVEIEERRRG